MTVGIRIDFGYQDCTCNLYVDRQNYIQHKLYTVIIDIQVKLALINLRHHSVTFGTSLVTFGVY